MQVGGGEVEYLTEKFFSLRNVPGVLKRQKKNYFFGGGGGVSHIWPFSLPYNI